MFSTILTSVTYLSPIWVGIFPELYSDNVLFAIDVHIEIYFDKTIF